MYIKKRRFLLTEQGRRSPLCGATTAGPAAPASREGGTGGQTGGRRHGPRAAAAGAAATEPWRPSASSVGPCLRERAGERGAGGAARRAAEAGPLRRAGGGRGREAGGARRVPGAARRGAAQTSGRAPRRAVVNARAPPAAHPEPHGGGVGPGRLDARGFPIRARSPPDGPIGGGAACHARGGPWASSVRRGHRGRRDPTPTWRGGARKDPTPCRARGRGRG